MANCYTAIDLGLTVIPVLNKIDLPAAEPDRVLQEIEDVIGIDSTEALSVSAKSDSLSRCLRFELLCSCNVSEL